VRRFFSALRMMTFSWLHNIHTHTRHDTTHTRHDIHERILMILCWVKKKWTLRIFLLSLALSLSLFYIYIYISFIASSLHVYPLLSLSKFSIRIGYENNFPHEIQSSLRRKKQQNFLSFAVAQIVLIFPCWLLLLFEPFNEVNLVIFAVLFVLCNSVRFFSVVFSFWVSGGGNEFNLLTF